MYQVHYQSHNAQCAKANVGLLIDHGCNGGIAGDDVCVLCLSDWKVNVTGIEDHQMSDLNIGSCAGITKTNHGLVVVILHQYAYTGKGRTIHSSTQLEMYKNQVDNHSKVVGGKQCIQMINGYIIPLDIQDGLPYMPLCTPTNTKLDTLPSIILTSDVNWDPCIVDNLQSNNPDWASKIKDPSIPVLDSPFDEYGDYCNITIAKHHLCLKRYKT